MNRAEFKTQAAPLDTRLSLWNDAISATEKSISLAAQLQKTGFSVLKQIDKASEADDADSEKLVRLYSKSLENITKGIAIERAARDKLIELHLQKPKK